MICLQTLLALLTLRLLFVLVVLGTQIDDKITGTNSGDIADVQDITEFDGYFDIDSGNSGSGWSIMLVD